MMPDNMSKRRLTKTALPVLLLLGSSLTPTVLADDASGAAYPLTTDSNCGCYRTNATTSNFFAHHQFFDFRSLTQYAVGSAPSPINAFDQSANAPPTSPYFSSSAWQGIWDIQTWNNSNVFKVNNSDLTGSDATIQMVNTPNNIYIERATDNSSPGAQTHLTMRTIRHSAFQSASEIESTSQGYQFLSVRMFARTTGATGAVTAMFTYRPPPNPTNLQLVQEADLEIRTRDPPTYVQYTNQPSWNSTSDIPQATRNVSIPGGKRWSDWTNFRMDWTPGSTTWYVNGQLASTIQFQAPRDPAQVIFNSWSDGGSWSGLMPVGQEAFLQIQWIEMVFNNTDPGQTKTGKCVNVCSIDDTSKTGQPVIITGNGGSSTPPSSGGGSSGSGSGGSSGGSSGGGNGGSGGSGGSSGGNSCQSAKYGQCGGKNWNGCKSCAAGTTCKFSNDYYSQCL